jgi:NAD(P)-dependent dehydrogenase (short-subunit alcohol dehydrogenase family)
MGQLDGKTALVTGASSGIGLAAARRFIAEGARVFITARRKEELAAAAEQLGERAVPVVGDVSDPSDLDRLFGEVSANGAGLDVVFANAGVGELATIDDITPASLEHVFGVNVGGRCSPFRRLFRC